jgi:hypothetical protein
VANTNSQVEKQEGTRFKEKERDFSVWERPVIFVDTAL